MVVTGLMSLLLGKDTNWDLLNYHLYNAYSFHYERTDIDQHPAGIRTYFNPLLDVAAYPLLTAVPDWVGGFLLGACHGVAPALVIGIARQLLGRSLAATAIAVMAGAAALTGAGVVSEIGTTLHDLTTAVVVLAALNLALFAILRHDSQRVQWAWCGAGLLLGAASGLKLTNAGYAVAAIIASLFVCRSWCFRPLILVVAGSVAGLLATHGWWSYELFRRYANPVYPFFNAWFQSPWFPAVNIAHTLHAPAGLVQAILFPFYFSWNHQTDSVYFRDFRFPAAYLCFIGLAVLQLSTARLGLRSGRTTILDAERWLLAFTVVSYVLWVKLHSIQRYAVAIEMLASVLCVVLLWRLLSMRAAVAASAVIVALLVLTTRPMNFGRTSWDGRAYATAINAHGSLEGAAVILGHQGLGYIAATLGSHSTVWVYQGVDDYADRAWGIPPFSEFDRAAALTKIGHRPPYVLTEAQSKEVRMARDKIGAFGFAIDGWCSSFQMSLVPKTYLLCPLSRGERPNALHEGETRASTALAAQPESTTLHARLGETLWLDVVLRNLGQSTLIANELDTLSLVAPREGSDTTRNLGISYRFVDRDDGPRPVVTRIPRSLSAGESIAFRMRIVAPKRTRGTFRLRLEIVDSDARLARIPGNPLAADDIVLVVK